jgi:hypothetical protein
MAFIVEAEGYTFYVKEERIDDDETIVIDFLSLKKQPYPCVRIYIEGDFKDTNASLHSINYYKSCSIKEKELEKHYGTIALIKTALTYMIVKYPHIKTTTLQDETFIDIPKKPLITTRRLVKGQPGWYEEYLNAKPNSKLLIKKLKLLRKQSVQEKLLTLLPPESNDNKWWVPENIKPVVDKIEMDLFKFLIGSPWIIDTETIKNYNIKLTITPDVSQKGGGKYYKKLKTVIKYGTSGYVNRHMIGR